MSEKESVKIFINEELLQVGDVFDHVHGIVSENKIRITDIRYDDDEVHPKEPTLARVYYQEFDENNKVVCEDWFRLWYLIDCYRKVK